MPARLVSYLASLALPLLVAGLAIGGCTSETTSPAGDADASTNDGATPSDGGAGSDSGKSPSDTAPDAAGGDCTNEELPPTPASCTIEGDYDVTTKILCPKECVVEISTVHYAMTVTVADGIAEFDNGSSSSPIRFSCTLDGCSCTTKSGEIYVFGAAGFDGIANATASGGCRFSLYEKGVRR